MNSLDPWRLIVTDAVGDIVLPRARYGHPFYSELPSWFNYENDATPRVVFDGAFVAGDIGGDPVVSGFFDSVKNAVLKYTGTSATNQFIKDQGLEPYVNMAAKAVATYYGGPAAGAAAGAIQPYLSNLGTKDKSKEAASKKQLQQLSSTVQQQNPELAPALNVAHDSVQKTATTYHVAQIRNDAKAGKPEAQQALASLAQAAANGDADAQRAMQLVTAIDNEQGKAQASGTVAGWVDIIGANMTNIVGAELTALSAPGFPYGSFGPYGYGRVFGQPYGYGFGRPYGVFFGAEPPADVTPPVVAPGPVLPRTGLTKELAPFVAPATGGISVKKHLDEKQILHVEICVDGKCHRTSMNLAPAIAMLMQKLATWHQEQHAPPPPPQTVVSTVQSAVGAAEDMIVGALVARHIDTIAGSLLGDIAGAVKGAVGGIASGVSSTFKKLKGPIGAAAGIAAAAGAAAIPGIGPIAAPIAGKLANDLVQSVGGDESAKKKVAQAQQQAKTDPAVALALEQATKAVANSTAAYHIKDTAKQAARGDAQAQQQIVKVADDAQKGDPAAKAVADLVANAMKSEWGAKLWEGVTGRGPGTVSGQWYDVVGQWYEMVGAVLDDTREKARAHAITKPGSAAGVLIDVEGKLHGRGFRNLDDAIDWLQHITRNRGSFTYAAAYEKDSSGAAFIQAEEVGSTPQPAPSPVTIPREGPAMTSGW